MERKLASIQRIRELLPIEGADFVCLASFTDTGWQCVVRKDWFQPGDLAVYFEIDSVLPENPAWDNIIAKYNYRIKTQKFRGVLSQGFAIPMYMVKKALEEELNKTDLDYLEWEKVNNLATIGADLTTHLNVKKWEPKESGPGAHNVFRKSTFPGFIPKTDETRIQSEPGLLEELRGLPYYITEKLDGTSFTKNQTKHNT
jgi:RNA ligase (TIGR02306 family)